MNNEMLVDTDVDTMVTYVEPKFNPAKEIGDFFVSFGYVMSDSDGKALTSDDYVYKNYELSILKPDTSSFWKFLRKTFGWLCFKKREMIATITWGNRDKWEVSSYGEENLHEVMILTQSLSLKLGRDLSVRQRSPHRWFEKPRITGVDFSMLVVLVAAAIGYLDLIIKVIKIKGLCF